MFSAIKTKTISLFEILHKAYGAYHMFSNVLTYFGILGSNNLETEITNMATKITQRLPSGELYHLSEAFLQMESNGGLKVALQDRTKAAIEKCAHTTGENIESAEILLNCAISTPKGGVTQKIAAFKKCADIDDVFEAADTIHDTVILSQCIYKDSQATIEKVQETIKSAISKDDLLNMAQAFREIAKNAGLKQALQRGIKTEIEKCVDITGKNADEAEKLLNCAVNNLEGGISKKAAAFKECADISSFDVLDTIQDTMVLVQCIGDIQQVFDTRGEL